MSQALESRVAAMEAKQQSLEVFLPAFLKRFEGMENRIDGKLEVLAADRDEERRSATWSRWSIAIGLGAIFFALLALIVVLAK